MVNVIIKPYQGFFDLNFSEFILKTLPYWKKYKCYTKYLNYWWIYF